MVTLPVNVVFSGSGVDGIKVRVTPVPSYASVPVTFDAPCIIKVEGVMVDGFIFSLKVTVITWFMGTPVAAFAGFVETTVGQTPTFST